MKKAKATSKRNNRAMTALGGLLGLILAYAFAASALDTASYWQYLATLVLLVLGIKLLVRTFKK